jgi:integrase
MLRFTLGGKRRDAGLGPYPTVTLTEAKVRARDDLTLVFKGIDPIDWRQAHREAALAKCEELPPMTFADCTIEYVRTRMPERKTNKRTRQQFENSLTQHVFPVIGSIPVRVLELSHVKQVLQPMWIDKTDMAMRLRSRMERVLDWATVHEHRDGLNPARWKGNLEIVLPPVEKLHERKHFAALRVVDLPIFMKRLVKRRRSNSMLAMQFLILTAARSGEVRFATWDEIDHDNRIWVQNADRTKTKKEHRVPLSEQAYRIVMQAERFAGTNLIWSTPNMRTMSDMALTSVLKKMDEQEVKSGGDGWRDRQSGKRATAHGFRSTFKDWTVDATEYPSEMAEVALAHNVANFFEQAYRRTDMLGKRRAMMQAWADYAYSKCLR